MNLKQKKPKFAYKVIRKTDDGLKVSMGYYDLPSSCRMTYREKVWNKPSMDMSKLFVFKRLKDALNFRADTMNLSEVWKVEVSDLTVGKYRVSMRIPSTKIDFIRFWNNPSEKCIVGSNILRVPTGTYFCNKLRLVKKVV